MKHKHVSIDEFATEETSIFGFPIQSSFAFMLLGRRYCIGPQGMRTLKLLQLIYDTRVRRFDNKWPFGIREYVKRIQRINSTRVLCLVAERTENPIMRILAIWLRGRCGGSLGTSTLARFTHHSDEQTRKEVARALKRMGAWAHLRGMAARDTSERIKRIATSEPVRPYRDRLGDFVGRMACVKVSGEETPLEVADNLDLGQGRPPKPTSLIRRILDRIHRLVSVGR